MSDECTRHDFGGAGSWLSLSLSLPEIAIFNCVAGVSLIFHRLWYIYFEIIVSLWKWSNADKKQILICFDLRFSQYLSMLSMVPSSSKLQFFFSYNFYYSMLYTLSLFLKSYRIFQDTHLSLHFKGELPTHFLKCLTLNLYGTVLEKIIPWQNPTIY